VGTYRYIHVYNEFVGVIASLDPRLSGRYIKPLAGLFWSRSGGGAFGRGSCL